VDDALKLADQLGQAIAATKVAQDLRAAREAMHADKDTMDLLEKFMEQSAKLSQRIQDQQPIEPDDKHALNDLQAQVAAREGFKAFSAAQVEYVDLMRRISQSILKHLRGIDDSLPPGGSA